MTALIALAFGIYLMRYTGFDQTAWILLGLGAFFLLFYTWPLKGLALGEIAVLIVWGPLMIGGGYFVLAQTWSWNVVIASLPYVLGVTTVIFGKHIDKLDMDEKKGIHTLPVVIGEKASRYAVLAMMIAPYLFTLYLIAVKFFTPILLIVFFALPTFKMVYPVFLKPKPETKPEGQIGWPLYFVGYAFVNNRKFGSLFMFGLLIDVFLRVLPFTADLINMYWN